MALHTKVEGEELDGQYLSVSPLFAPDGDGAFVPKHRLPDGPMAPDMAYEIIHDELMLDGNARLNHVQICWEKFCNYFEVEPRYVPMEGNRFHLSGKEAVKLCDENTIGVVAVLGSTFDGSYEPLQEISDALDDLQERTGLDVPIHVDGASGGMIAPFIDPDLVWDFRLPRVASINTSGHKYGRVYPGVGWASGATLRPCPKIWSSG